MKALGFDMALSVGQHTNDKELSYYAVTPSGSNGNSAGIRSSSTNPPGEPTTHQGISIWGRTPEGQSVVDILERFRPVLGRCGAGRTRSPLWPVRAFPTTDPLYR